MPDQDTITRLTSDVEAFFLQPNAYRTMLLFIVSLIAAWWLSSFVAKLLLKIFQFFASRSDRESGEDRLIRMRQVETYLSVTIAGVRAFIVAITAYFAWRALVPSASGGLAAIGAGTVFVVFAGQTVGILLRDVTAGTAMIIEKWFNVGDFIKVEPFADVQGVVERFTLRSTKLRNINGESIWIHNQQMMAVHVTPKALRTLAVDVFVRDRVAGEKALEDIIGTVPTGPTLLAKPLRITYAERWNDDLWRITITGQMPPGREWLIEKYFIETIKNIDADKKRSERLIIHEPIARYTDADAERRFKQAVYIDKPRS